MSKIEIPKQLWFVKANGSNLAYVSYYEDNAACRKKQETGRTWAGGRIQYERDPNDPHRYRTDDNGNLVPIARVPLAEQTVDNELIAGWKIKDDVKRWSTQNVVWRIESPHGFEFEIYSGNMMEILKCSTVKEGVIMDKCCLGKGNVLLPETSEPYREARAYTDLKNSARAKPSEMKPGDVVTFDNGREEIYCGKFYVISKSEEDIRGGSTRYKFGVSDKQYFFFKSDRNFYSYASVKIINIKTPDEPNTTDWMKEINQGYSYTSWPRSFGYSNCFGVCKNKQADIKPIVRPLDINREFDLETWRGGINGVIINDSIYCGHGVNVNALKSEKDFHEFGGYTFRIKDGFAEMIEHKRWVTQRRWDGRTDGYWAKADMIKFKSRLEIQSISIFCLEIDGEVYEFFNSYLTY